MTLCLRLFMFITDAGFLIYWGAMLFNFWGVLSLPSELMFANYQNDIIFAWNWSFFPLDFTLSIAGLLSVWLNAKGDQRWYFMAIISLTMTSIAGLMALTFWSIRGDFDMFWWGCNLFLLFWPVPFLFRLNHFKP